MDLLQGKLAAPVMEVVTRREGGLFPKPGEIHLQCSCPDWADLCKHVAATLYGIGARLDQRPELLFLLRGVDHLELIASATRSVTDGLATPASGKDKTLDESSLTEIFGIEIDDAAVVAVPKSTRLKPSGRPPRKETGRSKPSPATKTPIPKTLRAAKKNPASGSTPKKIRKRR